MRHWSCLKTGLRRIQQSAVVCLRPRSQCAADVFCLVVNAARYADAVPPSDVLSSQVDRGDVAELFDVLVTQPLRRVHRPEPCSSETVQTPASSGSRRLIVLDGLDECDPADRDLLFRLIGGFDQTTPDWLYLLVTVGDDEEGQQLVGKLDAAQKVELKADVTDAETSADVRRYLHDSMARRIDRISLDGALSQLAKNAQANFLCARFLKVTRNVAVRLTT